MKQLRAICIYRRKDEASFRTAVRAAEIITSHGGSACTDELFDFLDIRFIDHTASVIRALTCRPNDCEGRHEAHFLRKFACRHCLRSFSANMEESPADVIICTHPYALSLISVLSTESGLKIPVVYTEKSFLSASVYELPQSSVLCFASTKPSRAALSGIGMTVFPFPSVKAEQRNNCKHTILRNTSDKTDFSSDGVQFTTDNKPGAFGSVIGFNDTDSIEYWISQGKPVFVTSVNRKNHMLVSDIAAHGIGRVVSTGDTVTLEETISMADAFENLEISHDEHQFVARITDFVYHYS